MIGVNTMTAMNHRNEVMYDAPDDDAMKKDASDAMNNDTDKAMKITNVLHTVNVMNDATDDTRNYILYTMCDTGTFAMNIVH